MTLLSKVKSKREISSNFVPFSEYLNFMKTSGLFQEFNDFFYEIGNEYEISYEKIFVYEFVHVSYTYPSYHMQ